MEAEQVREGREQRRRDAVVQAFMLTCDLAQMSDEGARTLDRISDSRCRDVDMGVALDLALDMLFKAQRVVEALRGQR